MTALDYGFILLIVVMTLLSWSKGAAAEILALLQWLVALYIAGLFYTAAADLVLGGVDPPWLRLILAFGALFLITFVILHFFAANLEKGISFLGLSGLNHFLGLLLGLFKSGIILLALVFVLAFTPMVTTEVWRQSLILPYLQELLREVSPYIQTWIDAQLNNIPKN